jgi:hypothetical protein
VSAYSRKVNKAVALAKARYGNLCVISQAGIVDGAHIVPRDIRRDLAYDIDNIMPLNRVLHQEFDKLPDRDFAKRANWLIDNAHVDTVGKVKEQIEILRGKL